MCRMQHRLILHKAPLIGHVHQQLALRQHLVYLAILFHQQGLAFLPNTRLLNVSKPYHGASSFILPHVITKQHAFKGTNIGHNRPCKIKHVTWVDGADFHLVRHTIEFTGHKESLPFTLTLSQVSNPVNFALIT